jgi:serine/threonine protein kinase
MDCPGEDAIAGYVEGNLDAERRATVTEHLAACPACRALVSELARDLPTDPLVTTPEPRGHTLPGPSAQLTALPPGAFRDGEVIAERYEVRRFLAAGGMGEVYEAEDRELHTRIALKTVRSEATHDPRMLVRFKREIALARKVTHPNVCRIFDVGFHQAGARRVAFLSMELIEGETLAARLERGPMRVDEALPLVTQLIAGLAAAHAEGVIHRDFKSANVMLVARPSGARAIITDFGLARGGEEHAVSVASGHQGLVGTPVYMAPEQVAGLPLGAAADQYALGVVMFEMVTGHWPFVGDTPVLTAVRRLHEPAPSPRSYAPDLDPRWEAAILRCLARAPEDRFSSLAALEAALSYSEPVPLPTRSPESIAEAGLPIRSRWPWLVGALVLGLAIAATQLWHGAPPAPARPLAATPVVPLTAPAAPVAPVVAPAPTETPAVVATPPLKPNHPTHARPRNSEQAEPRTATKTPGDPALDHFIMHYPGSAPAK